MPTAAATPNRDPAAVERVLQDQAEAPAVVRGRVRFGEIGPKREGDPVLKHLEASLERPAAPRKASAAKQLPPERIVIDDAVPMPRAKPKGSVYRDAMSQMRVGQSFFVERDRHTNMSGLGTLRKTLLPKVFTTGWREVGEDEVYPNKQGFRIWRTK